MFMNYRQIFANVTWRNPDGGSEFWPLFNLHDWIPNCIATNPEYGLILLWIAATGFFILCFNARTQRSP
jgi:hypothetical protein